MGAITLNGIKKKGGKRKRGIRYVGNYPQRNEGKGGTISDDGEQMYGHSESVSICSAGCGWLWGVSWRVSWRFLAALQNGGIYHSGYLHYRLNCSIICNCLYHLFAY